MANPTSNFGWQMPTPVDLVTDLPADFEVFGQAVDSSLADLKGGSTGQILAKNSNTDMDFVWVANDVGDITAVTAGTGITGGGTSGEVTVSFDQANFGGGQYAAGKNKIINGDFSIAQRGSSISLGFAFKYIQDRWNQNTDSGPTGTVSQTAFTPGTAPVAGYEGQSYLNFNMTAITGGSFYVFAANRMEDVRTLAGQTATISFWAKADTTRTIGVKVNQNFGSGGSSGVVTTATTTQALTTSWVRYTYTISIPSIAGKTIGAGSYLELEFTLGSLVPQQINLWGVQLEAGSFATPFQTATGTIQGEFDACTWYYDKRGGQAGTGTILNNALSNSAGTNAAFSFPIKMRVAPTAVEYASLRLSDTSSGFTVSSVTLTNCTSTTANVNVATTGMTGFRSCYLDSSATGNYIAFSAEL